MHENNEKNTTFINHSKGIKIEDKEDEILSYSNEDSTEEEVKLMLDIALAKGWNLLEIEIDGTPQFIKEAKKQILIKVEVQNQTQKKEEENKEIKKVEIKPTRPVSQLDNCIFENESKIFESEKANDLKFLKENLSAQIVLDFAIRKYNINLDEFEVVDDNKINNKTNRQKPKSIIDFFTKEIGVSIKETTEICNNLMTKQPKKVVDKIEDEEKSQELIYPYIDENLEQNKEILNEKNKRKKRKN
ncbi:hypothetical protein PJV89_05545 [Aliarcobacter butzleri]|nr:hypothetical protein [Aliarcobacter butzleri]